ncbi:MAG: hypothetical protein ACR2QE_08275 [Acidimicrobiales bacterium]
MVIPLTIGVVVKWFGSRRNDSDDDVQGDHPIVRAMLKSVNTGDFGDITDLIDDECRFYINAEELAREGDDNTIDRGPDLWVDAIADTREVYPKVHWELYDELSGEDEGKQKITIRFVSKGEADGETDEFEVAGFGVVEDDKLVEWRQVADMETYNRRRVFTGEDPVGTD